MTIEEAICSILGQLTTLTKSIQTITDHIVKHNERIKVLEDKISYLLKTNGKEKRFKLKT